MKIYLINWSYYSFNDGSQEIEAIYSTFDKALEHVQKECKSRNLEQVRNRKTKELVNTWTDGDYWISIAVGYIDSPALYMSKEEYEDCS